jgi:hypothetical protein
MHDVLGCYTVVVLDAGEDMHKFLDVLSASTALVSGREKTSCG